MRKIGWIIREKPLDILKVLDTKEKKILQISREADTTFSYCSTIMRKFEKLGIINSRKADRSRYIKLTEKGQKLKSLILNIPKILNNQEEENNGI